ncbi:lyase [Actinorhabdospora filicis]|uniref:Lyase n=1 Tax=Actinorhabdospora filicis TaxID=1785913 RepID=A0A9W6WAM2_9ACTN|nr:polysaccharide lyase 8 family protein [Actinorhabdospora filicis]GLZ79148.1 lyase [Actinorhabdospora filicis]
MRRRTLLTAAALGGASVPFAALPASADDVPGLRARAAALLTGGDFDPADPAFAAPLASLAGQASAIAATLIRDPARDRLWPDLGDLTTTIANVSLSYRRLRTLALAWATPGTAHTGDPALLAEVLAGLDLLYQRGYNETKPETGNWWFWEIGNPRALMDVCVLVHEHLGPERLAASLRVVDRFCPDADRRTNAPTLAETGANRADKAVIVALRGIVGGTPAKLASARDAVSDVRDAGRNTLLGYETTGDGFYEDGSFVQHTYIAYTGTYGNVLLAGLAFIMRLLAGSPWEITDPARTVVFDAVERTFAPFMHDGLMLDTVAGRAISRETAGNHAWGNDTVGGALLLAESAPPEYAARFRALAKGWIRARTSRPYLDAAPLAALPRALAAVRSSARPARLPNGFHVFADMDRVVHRRPAWTLALGLSSRRIATYESGNGENPRGWFTGDGVTYLYDGDQDQFSDAFWPTVDSQRLPGTTVDPAPRAPFSGSLHRPATTWSGGASLDTVGVAGLDLAAFSSALRARKSWFCLPEAVICLGAGITAPAETVIENRNLHTATPRLVIDGEHQPRDPGAATVHTAASWANLDGTAGYVLLEPADLHALREDRTGAWRDINTGADTGGSTTPLTRRYQTMWLTHTSGGTYAYALLPGASLGQTRHWARRPPVTVLANTADAQAVAADGLLMAAFWRASSVPGLTASGPCAVVARTCRDRLELAVSDPSRTAASVTLDLPLAVTRQLDGTGFTVDAPGRVTVALGGTRGHTLRGVFAL